MTLGEAVIRKADERLVWVDDAFYALAEAYPQASVRARIDRMVRHNLELTADARQQGWPSNRAPGRHYAPKRGAA